MRVFYAVHDHYWEDANLLAGLRDAGREVVRYDPGHAFHEALRPEWTAADRQRVSERLVREVRAEHSRRPLDVFFGYFLKQLVYPEAIREISGLGIPTVNYWCNGAHQFHLVDEISPAFDYCVVTERAALPSYKAVGANPVYLQMAANPRIYRPYETAREFDVTFVGQRYADRPIYVLHLLKNGIAVRVWGPGWTADRTFGEKSVGLGLTWRYLLRHPRSSLYRLLYHGRRAVLRRWDIPPWDERRLARVAGPSLPQEELVRMYSRARISLGFSTCGDARYHDRTKVRQVHLRDFEAPMSGALHFVEYQEELQDFYEIGREIVCYTTREELLDKVRYYLVHPDEAERVRAAGRRRALAEHTWAHRFQQLFSQIGLDGRRPAAVAELIG
jgi:hypothetical protein